MTIWSAAASPLQTCVAMPVRTDKSSVDDARLTV
jgi:hypothetical protein